MRKGRIPSSVTPMATPESSSPSRLTSISEGLVTSRRPRCIISYMPISLVEPKRFLIARSSLYMCWRSPSNCSTASTMCSSTFGPAMVPSLLICPMSSTGTPLSLAYFSNEAAHSRTWLTLPAEDSRVSEAMVCMESTTSISGWTWSMCWKMFSSDVSQTMNRLSDPRPMRSARSFSWVALSSPLT